MKTKLKKISKEQFKLDDETIKKIESLSEDEINSYLKNSCENYYRHKKRVCRIYEY